VSRLSSPCTLIALLNVIDIVLVTVEAVEFFREPLSMTSSALSLTFSLGNEYACPISLRQGKHELIRNGPLTEMELYNKQFIYPSMLTWNPVVVW
jgi:hypothetical protein